MTTFKAEIESLYQENSKTSSVTAKFARALNIVINTSLKGGSGFLLELLQNAEDAGATEVVVRLIGDYLTLEHNGAPFSITDIKEVCDFGHDQDTSKAENNQKIGYKGVGFKAVFTVSDKVFVVTPEGVFSFDKAHFQNFKDKNNIPWQVCPIFIESDAYPKQLSQHQRHSTIIALKLKSNVNLDNEVKYLADNPETLLFLHNIKNLKLHTKEFSSELQVSKTSNIKDAHTVIFNHNNQPHSRWFVMNSDVDLDEKAFKILNDPNVDGTEYPNRLRSLKQIQIQFAARLDDNDKIIPGNGQFFAGLPTQVKTDALPVLVNCSNILLDASRKQLQENPWNQYLLTQIPQLLVGWMRTLAQLPEHRFHVLSLLPMPKISVLPDSLQSSYESGIATASSIKCIPMKQGETTLQLAWQDESGFMEAFPQFSKQDYVHQQLQHKQRLSYFHMTKVQTNRVLTLQEISKQQLASYFSSDLSPQFQQQLWRFIIAQTVKMGETPNWLVNNLRIVGMDNALHAVKSFAYALYLPSPTTSDFETIIQFPLVHPALYQADIEVFLGSLGIKTVSPTLIIQQFLIPALEKNTHPERNVAMLTYVLKHYSILTASDFDKLARAHVKTTKGEYLPVSQLYLADSYDPEIKLEKIVPDSRCFIAVDYLVTRAIPWKEHFLKLGVAENFKARNVTYTKDCFEVALGGGKYAREFFQSKHKFDLYHTDRTYTIPMIELITDARYSVVIWNSILAHGGGQSYIKYYLQHAPVCLASDGNHYPSLSLLSNDVSPLVKSVLPHATLPVNDINFKHLLELRVNPTAAEWMQVLDALNRNKSRNIAYYNEVLMALYTIAYHDGKTEVVKALTADWQGELLAGNGTLQPIKKLHSCEATHFIMRPTAHWLSQAIEQSERIAELFHITKINDWSYSYSAKNAKPDEKTMARVTNLQAISTLVFIENMGREYNHQQSVEEMRDRLSRLKFSVADEISITYKADNSGKVLQTTDVVKRFGREMIYTHSVASPFVAPELAKELQGILSLKNPHMDRILTMFISYDYAEFTKYLEQYCGYNLADIPKVKIDPPKEKEEVSEKPRIYVSVPLSRNNVFSSAPSSSFKSESASAPVEQSQQSERAGMSAEEKAKRFQFVSGFKLGEKGVILESETLSFEDITDKVKLFILQEVKQYSRKGKAHEWGRGAVFQHLLRHYMEKFSPDVKMAKMQSPTQIRFISSDHRIIVDVELIKYEDKANKKSFDGDIQVTKRIFNKDGALITEKVNKINVISKDAPKEGIAANINLHWSKDKKEACRLDNGSSNKQLQISDVKVSI